MLRLRARLNNEIEEIRELRNEIAFLNARKAISKVIRLLEGIDTMIISIIDAYYRRVRVFETYAIAFRNICEALTKLIKALTELIKALYSYKR